MTYRFSLLALLFTVLCTSCQCTRDIDIEGQILESCENPVGVEGIHLEFEHGDGREEATTDANGRFHFQFTVDRSDFNIWGGSLPQIKYTTDSTYGRFQVPESDTYDYGKIYLNHYEEVALEFTGIPDSVDLQQFDSVYIAVNSVHSNANVFPVDVNSISNGYITPPYLVRLQPGVLTLTIYCLDASTSQVVFLGDLDFEEIGLRCFDEPILMRMEYLEP
ncbi:hypothetical protein [Phaeocystidibacter luteus]|uniref:Uncharacterized protein n=1 Tax=Phaeocystidibacter luteus TaxID=911197 RepID=A0A6N6RMA3_9FLAO|nr:hypothetical protein [Phaeocystidibacter luteus]KAB2814682.1 hypothetical protein F8C67_02760 [Phaeocystidibacter luteus]